MQTKIGPTVMDVGPMNTRKDLPVQQPFERSDRSRPNRRPAALSDPVGEPVPNPFNSLISACLRSKAFCL